MTTLTEGQHKAEFLVSEAPGYRSREKVIVKSAQNLEAGEVIGLEARGIGKADIPTVVGTGNGTMSALFAGPDVEVGNYVATCTAAVTNGGVFSVVAPSGKALPSLTLTVGAGATTAYASSHVNFSITDGSTDFAEDDVFTIAVAASTTATVVGTGNGTLTALAMKEATKTGRYRFQCTVAVTNGGTFRVTDPDGLSLGDYVILAGAGGVVTVDNEAIKATITDGSTDFAVGDFFEVFVYNELTKKAVEWNPAAVNGAEDPYGILYEGTGGALAADKVLAAVVRDAEVNQSELQFATTVSDAEKEVAYARLAENGIVARPASSVTIT